MENLRNMYCCICKIRCDKLKSKNEIRHVNDLVDIINTSYLKLSIKKSNEKVQIKREDLLCNTCRNKVRKIGTV